MARASRQKQKILYLLRLLLEETDEKHPLTVPQMIDALERAGISAERKSIYSDLEELRLFGLDLVCTRGKTTGYFVGERTFQLPELRLLVDAVQSSRFLTKKKSEELIGKLESLLSRHEAAGLSHQVFVSGRIKTMNESIYRNVDTISCAIDEDKKIRFRYFEWGAGGEKKFRRDGAFYTVSPFYLIWDDENYYLVAQEEESGEKRHFRVDKMLAIQHSEEARGGHDLFRDFDPALYEKKTFGMWNGTEERVTLWCAEELAGVFFDRFGQNLVTRKTDGGFETTVSVLVGPLFFSYLMGFGKRVKILAPASVKNAFCRLAEEALSNYENEEKRS